jgi:aconitate hydratase
MESIRFNATVRTAAREYRYVALNQTLGETRVRRMPLSLRIFAENILRQASGDCEASLNAVLQRRRDVDIAFHPARVVLQDLLATPALADLAALRDAVAARGGDPLRVNPGVPVDLVIDHSVTVERTGAGALEHNMAVEKRRNAERFEFFNWCGKAFENLRIVPPGRGILHQINLEHFSPVVVARKVGPTWVAYPDTLVGTDSHTPMINALGVLGWGVGGIEAEAVMLGRGIRMRLPEIVGLRLSGVLSPGVLATDLALTLAERLRAEGVVGAIVEPHGAGVATLSVPDRATVSNMAPEYGATAVLFPIDRMTLDYLEMTGRSPEQRALVDAYAKAQGLWVHAAAGAEYDRVIEFDLSSVVPVLAGPREPHQRIALSELAERGIADRRERAPRDRKVPDAATAVIARNASDEAIPERPLPDAAVVIAAITSCTNTSNPRAMIAAGLLARNAVARGLHSAPWVKCSLAPGSRAVIEYYKSSGLYEPMRKLGFDVVGFGCTTCAGMSGPLAPEVESEIASRRLDVAAVLSGNRNFDGRIHPLVRHAFLGSPPLVVAYALTGTMRHDIQREPLGLDRNGREVFLRDVWPRDEEIEATMREHVQPKQFISVYSESAVESEASPDNGNTTSLFHWRRESTYVRQPPYWQAEHARPVQLKGMRALVVLGDNITTDHISPAGAIAPGSAAGTFLQARGVPIEEFNAYGARRANHDVMMRATFANIRLRNEMTPDLEGPYTRVFPEDRVTSIFEAAEIYANRAQPLVVVGGRNYGCGSSRDWAAKGPRLLGVSAVIAESFERIHRSNLAGMGVLPLQFPAGVTRRSLGLDGSEIYDLEGVEGAIEPRTSATLRITRADGSQTSISLTCRLDSAEEIAYFRAGGLLPMMCDQLVSAA